MPLGSDNSVVLINLPALKVFSMQFRTFVISLPPALKVLMQVDVALDIVDKICETFHYMNIVFTFL